MNYYRYDPDAEFYAGIGFNPQEIDVLSLHGIDSPLSPSWNASHRAHGFDDNPPAEGDFPSLSNFRRIPVISGRAWQTLEPLIGYCCEALPIEYPSGKPYFIIHVMETIDCLDTNRAEVRRSKIDGRINRIWKYALKEKLLTDKHIFKLPRESGGELLVNDVFRQTVEEHGLRGLLFEELPMTSEAT